MKKKNITVIWISSFLAELITAATKAYMHALNSATKNKRARNEDFKIELTRKNVFLPYTHLQIIQEHCPLL